MRIMVMDGQGGGVGRSLLEALKERFPEAELIAVGTNATACLLYTSPSPRD